jgi:DNA adenine methylase
LKSPLKWAGGKYRLLEQIRNVLPKGNRLVEPFVGAGSVFLNTNYSNYWINDINKDLINLYQVIRTNHHLLLEQAERLFEDGNNKEDYYLNRQIFNERNQDKIKQASLFLYLNRHCFNGLCRYNKKNQFNVPFGKYKTIYLPESEITSAHKKLQNVKITSLPFEEVFSDIKQGDVIYCDPPYHNTFTQYASGGFSKTDHQKLADLSYGLDVVISNSYNEETLAIFSNASEQHEIEASRAISRDASGRCKVSELLAVYRKSA